MWLSVAWYPLCMPIVFQHFIPMVFLQLISMFCNIWSTHRCVWCETARLDEFRVTYTYVYIYISTVQRKNIKLLNQTHVIYVVLLDVWCQYAWWHLLVFLQYLTNNHTLWKGKPTPLVDRKYNITVCMQRIAVKAKICDVMKNNG